MTYNPDGTIQKLPWWNDEGVAQVGKFDPFAQTEAATICYEKGVKTLPRAEGKPGVYVSVTENGAYIKIKGVDFGDKGTTKFTANLAALADDASITLRLDSEVGTPIGIVKVKPTGGLDKWESQSCNITGTKGVHDLYLKFFSTGTPQMNVNWWKFE